MVYFFVNKNGTEGCANEIPKRILEAWFGWKDVYGEECTITTLPNGTIEKVIGKKLTWEDEPYEYNGVQSVDENPKEKLVSIDKVCEWLSKTLYIHTEEIEDMYCNEDGTFDYVTSDFDSVSDFIEGFRKAMEE